MKIKDGKAIKQNDLSAKSCRILGVGHEIKRKYIQKINIFKIIHTNKFKKYG